MFASLTGIIQKKYADYFILNVHGVGYKVSCSTQTLLQLDIGNQYFFYVETSIGEDFIKLYGFLTEAEKNWFLHLSSVQGVGGKAALAILSVARPDMISDAILLGDKSIVIKAAGVGPKLADRIINELKHKKDLPACYDTDDMLVFNASEKTDIIPHTIVKNPISETPSSPTDRTHIIEKRKIIDNSCSALINLGYNRADSLKAIHEVQNDTTIISENALITAALQHIARLKEDV